MKHHSAMLSIEFLDGSDNRRKWPKVDLFGLFNGDFRFEVDSGVKTNSAGLARLFYLNLGGYVNVKITAKSGDFYVVSSELVVDRKDHVAVSEPASVVLFGLGLIGPGFACRKQS